jgi:hypothetical protein
VQQSKVSNHIALTPRLRYRCVGNEGVLVHLDTACVIVVNEVGLYIVQSLQRPMTRDALVEAIVGEFQVERRQAEQDLAHFLRELAGQQMLAAQPTITAD